MPKLSIIIACYNCSQTLEEAVASCFTQGFNIDKGELEIVLVDDASTDATRLVMKKLADTYSSVIKTFFHEKNKGGGATRNTAITNANADVVFCLDSDDMLAPNTLSKMLTYMKDKQAKGCCDGVGVSTSIKFKGKDVNNIAYTSVFTYCNQQVPFEALFEKGPCSFYSTFMLTKKAFEITGGYPTAHGFDTQGFAMRFFSHGLVGYVCPDTTYLHRIAFHKSYYTREYESGKTNYNWLLVLEEILHLLSDESIQALYAFDLHSSDSIYDTLCSKYPHIFKTRGPHNYTKYLSPLSEADYTKDILSSSQITAYDYYWLGLQKLVHPSTHDSYAKAYEYFIKSLQLGFKHPRVYYMVYESIARINNTTYKEVGANIDSYFSFRKRGAAIAFPIRICNYIKKIIKRHVRKIS